MKPVIARTEASSVGSPENSSDKWAVGTLSKLTVPGLGSVHYMHAVCIHMYIAQALLAQISSLVDDI